MSILAEKAHDLPTAEHWIRLAPAHATVTDAPIDRLRRASRPQLPSPPRRREPIATTGTTGRGTRYYHTAIEALAADAGKLGLPKQPGKPDPFARYLGAEPPFPIAPAVPRRFVVTDEPNPELRIGFRRQPPARIRGLPGVLVNASVPHCGGRQPGSDSGPHRLERSAPHFQRRIVPPPGSSPTYPVAENGNVRITSFFRGRLATTDVPVDLYRLPDRIAVKTPGLKSIAVAMRAHPRVRGRFGLGRGVVAIVLDCSGSLAPPDPKNLSDPGLYPQAVKALDSLLRQLPPGTTITVSVLGQRTPDAKSAEETIREVLPPTALPFETSSVITRVNEEVANLQPWDHSPLVRAVLKAKDRIAKETVPFKAVVLISDAVDNRWAEDPQNAKPKRSVRDALRAAFPAAGVSLSVVALEAPQAEAAKQAEFKEVEKLSPAGMFVPVERVNELAVWLRKGLNPQVRFALDAPGGNGTDLTAGTDSADNWTSGRLEPGAYQMRVAGVKDFAQRVELRPGDRLLLELAEDGGTLTAMRHWWTDTAAGTKSGKPSDAWRLNLLQNRSTDGRLRLFAAIEERPAPAKVLQVSRLGDVWFEVFPVVPTAPQVAARWRGVPGLSRASMVA